MTRSSYIHLQLRLYKRVSFTKTENLFYTRLLLRFESSNDRDAIALQSRRTKVHTQSNSPYSETRYKNTYIRPKRASKEVAYRSSTKIGLRKLVFSLY